MRNLFMKFRVSDEERSMLMSRAESLEVSFSDYLRGLWESDISSNQGSESGIGKASVKDSAKGASDDRLSEVKKGTSLDLASIVAKSKKKLDKKL